MNAKDTRSERRADPGSLEELSAAIEAGAGMPAVARAAGRALDASVALIDRASNVLAVAAASPDEEPGDTPGDTRQQAGRGPGDMDPQKVVWVPIAGQVAGGSPILPLEPGQGRLPLPKEVVGAEEGLFILKVVGDSMTGAGIFSGDWVVVRELFDKPKNGDIVAALLDGHEVEGTVKTYKKVKQRVWLMPHHPAHTPIPGDNAIIRGKVVAVLRQV